MIFFPVVRSSKDDTYIENPRKKLCHVIGKKETENCKDNDQRMVEREIKKSKKPDSKFLFNVNLKMEEVIFMEIFLSTFHCNDKFFYIYNGTL